MTSVATLEDPETGLSADLLIGEIEHYLTTRTPPTRTAHPLVSKTTAELIEEALAAPASASRAPALAPPSRALRLLPDWALSLPILRQAHGAGRPDSSSP